MNTLSTAPADLAAVTDRARAAARPWAALPVRERLAHVERFRRALLANRDRLIAELGAELGKTPVEVLGGEVLATADACRFLTRQAAALLRPRRVGGRPAWLRGQRDEVHRRPRGVVGIIGTWNYPLFLNGVQALHALTAGNAVVWKPSEVAPRFAVLLAQLMSEAGYPAYLFQPLPATREMGAILADADIDHVVFTGGAAVGRKLAARLGERLVSSTLELSGCDAMFVLEGADAHLAARAAFFGATANRGQTCIAVRRAFVHRSLYSAFRDALRPLVEAAAEVSLQMPAQQEQFAALTRQAASEGGEVVGGPRRPAVVFDARPDMAVCREAAFAPVMAVMPYDTLEQALAMEARCPYALAASVFTPAAEPALALAARLRAGAVTINDVVVPTAHPGTPFGGRGASGWGVTQGAEGLLEMTVPQAVSFTSGKFRPHYDTSPGRQAFTERLLRAVLDATHAPTLWGRLGGGWRMLWAIVRGK